MTRKPGSKPRQGPAGSIHPGPTLTERLVEGHREFLSFLERRLGDRALAEDILQDAFVKSIERGGALRDKEAVTAWFYRMLRNAVIDHHRREQVRNRALEMLARELRDSVEPPHELHGAICACIGRVASTIKTEYAVAIQKIEVEGMALETFAKENHITAQNAAVRVFRARQVLRKQVRAACGTCAEHGCEECSCGK